MILAIAGIVIFVGGLTLCIWWLVIKPRGLLVELLAPAVVATLAIYVALAPEVEATWPWLWAPFAASLGASIAIRLVAKYNQLLYAATDIDAMQERRREELEKVDPIVRKK